MQTSFPEPKYFICSLTLQAARKMIAHYNRVLVPLGITAQLCCKKSSHYIEPPQRLVE